MLERACRRSRPALDAIFDGRASEAQESALRAHTDVCEACSVELARTNAYRAMLDTLGEAEITRRNEDVFVASVFASIDADEPVAERVLTRGRVLAVAASLLVAASPLVVRLVGSSLTDTPDDGGAARNETSGGTSEPVSVAIAPVPADVVPPLAPASQGPVDGRTPVDVASFARALETAAATTGFAADAPGRAARFIEELRSIYDGDEVRAARKVVRTDEHESLGLAARVLGPRADARDRRRLVALTRGGERSAAWALVDRRSKGIAALWDVALQDVAALEESEAERAHRSLEMVRAVLLDAAEAGRIAGLDGLDVSAAPEFAVHLIERVSEDPAREFMDRWLASGDVRWLDAWSVRDDREGALIAVTGDLATPGRRAERVLRAIERSGDPVHLDLVVRALRDGVSGASVALAALRGDEAVEALFGLTRLGVLSESREERAWNQLVASDPGRVASYIGDADSDARVAIESVVRFTDGQLDETSETLLFELAGRRALRAETRTAAFLALAELAPAGGAAPTPRAKNAAAALARSIDSEELRLAAAAWLVRIRFRPPSEPDDDRPPFIARAIARGGSVSVQHLRFARALRAERSSGAPW